MAGRFIVSPRSRRTLPAALACRRGCPYKPVPHRLRACAARRSAGNAILVLGGAGYSIFPAAALDYLGADFGIAGEGELAFPVLLEAIEGDHDPSSLPRVYVRGAPSRSRCVGQIDLVDQPTPYPDLMQCLDPEDPELWVPVQTRRGCPLDCSYCSTPLIEGRTVRHRTPQVVVEELAGLAAAGIDRMGFLMLGVPGETRESVSESLEFADTLGLTSLKITFGVRIYPGTSLARFAVDEGVVSVPGFRTLESSIIIGQQIRPRQLSKF